MQTRFGKILITPFLCDLLQDAKYVSEQFSWPFLEKVIFVVMAGLRLNIG